MKALRAKIRPLAQEAMSHWETHLPKMYEQLLREGKLEETAMFAAEQTMKEIALLMRQGMQWSQAWEMTREKYLFLPEEEGLEAEDEEPDELYKLLLESDRLMAKLEEELDEIRATKILRK